MTLYTIELWSPDGTRLADISQMCTTRTFRVRRNRPEDIYLTVDLKKAQKLSKKLGIPFYQLYAPGITEVRIRRGSRYLVGGQIAWVYPQLTREGATMEIRAVGFLDLWAKRFMVEALQTIAFENEDMATIAWLIQSGSQGILTPERWDFGVSEGAVQTSRDITETFKANAQTIKEILIGFTERADGIDIEFTPDKQFNAYYPGIGTNKTELLFSYPGNIVSIGLPRDATNMANLIVSRGEGNGDAQVAADSQDYDSQAAYKVKMRIDDYPSVRETDNLQEKGDEVLRLYGNPTTIPEVTLDGSMEPSLGSYWIGDRVRFSVDTDEWPAFALIDGQTWKIDEITCSLDENEHEDITLKVGY